jgi:GT2 family glycosyltransferase
MGRELYEPRPGRARDSHEGEENSRPSNAVTVSVVVPTFDSETHIAECLESAHRLLPGAQVIVVDNGSRDGTLDIVGRFPDVTVLAGHGNVGFGRACNLGRMHASGELILFLNPDASLIRVDLGALGRYAAEQRFGLVGAELSESEGEPRPALMRQSERWVSELFAVHLLGILSRIAPAPRFVERSDGSARYTIGGAAFLARGSELAELGGFDERFFMYYEDTDLTQRYLSAGHPLRATRALAAEHARGGSADVSLRNALSFLGWLEYLSKWEGEQTASRAARAARVCYTIVLGGLSVLGAVILRDKVKVKADELRTMLSHIASEGLVEVPGTMKMRYPSAGPLAADIFRSWAPSGRA